MANGFMGKLQSLLGLAGLVALGISVSLVSGVNPVDYVDDVLVGTLDKLKGKLTDPPPRWSERVDGPAVAAAVSANRVLVVLNGAVEARRLSDGGHAWSRTVDWAVPAGEVVVAGRASGGGFEVLDAMTGRVRWQDDAAKDAWPYHDLVLSLGCDRGDGCVMRARSPADGAVRWQRRLTGAAQRLAGYPEFEEAIDRTGMLHPDYPGYVPRLVGVVTDREVTVLDTGTGAVLGRLPEDADTRVWMSGDRVLGVTARAERNGGCRYSVRAWNPSGAEVWRRNGFDLGTVSGSGCEQRRDPLAASGVLAAVGADDRPALLGVRRGDVRWTGRPGETLVGTDGLVAVVRAGGRLTAVNAESGAALWTRAAGRKAAIVVTRYAVLVQDPDELSLTAVSPADGTVLARWRTQAVLVGSDDEGVVLRNGRTVGYVPW